MSESFVLSLAAVDILSEVLDISCRLVPFEIPSVGALDEDRIRIATIVLRDLRDRGLIRDNVLHRDLEAAMRLVYDHQVAVAVAGVLPGGKPLFARVSAAGETGVVAVLDGQLMRFELIRSSSLARAAVGLLPEERPGPGQSVLVTSSAPVVEGERSFVQQVRPARSGADVAGRAAQAILDRPRKGSGFFLVSGKGRHGREVRGGNLSWIDTEDGRYLTLTKPAVDGVVRTTYSPADRNRLVQQLSELLEGVMPRR